MGTSDRNDQKKRDRGYNSRGRFEQWARNPSCQANVLSAVVGIDMQKIAASSQIKSSIGPSSFAIARGHMFERNLFRDDAKICIDALKQVGMIPEGHKVMFEDLRIKSEGGPSQHIDEALKKTRELLAKLSRTPSDEETFIIAGPVVKIPGSEVLLPEAILIIDVLVMRPLDKQWECIVGEVKTYADRGGYTDTQDLAGARAQAGLYIHALQCVIDNLNLTNHFLVSQSGFLILSRVGSFTPSVRVGEDLRYMAKRAKTGFEKMRQIADTFAQSSEETSMDTILKASRHYKDDCLSFCDLASQCRDRAAAAGLPAILGQSMEQFTMGLSLHRVLELIEGQKGPTNEQEESFLQIYLATTMADRRKGA